MIREYSPSGQDLGLITSTGLDHPYDVAFGPNGNIVANFGDNSIHEFSSSGTDLGVFASRHERSPALVFSNAVPEPSSAILLLTAASMLSLHCAFVAVRLRPRSATTWRSCLTLSISINAL